MIDVQTKTLPADPKGIAEAARLLKVVEPGMHTTEELIRRALQGAARD